MDPEGVKNSKGTIKSFLEKAEVLGYECDETKQAVVLLGRIVEEEETLDRLDQAVCTKDQMLESRETDLLRTRIEECTDMGIESQSILDAQKLLKNLQDEIAARIAFELAEKRRLEEEAERKRLAEEAERQRLADEAEKMRLAEEAERIRVELEAKRRREEEEAERLRVLAEEEEAKRAAEHKDKLRLRVENEGRVKRALVEAANKLDLKQLNEAIQEAIHLGLQDTEVEQANSMRTKLQLLEETKSKLVAACAVPKLERGISAADVKNLDTAIDFAESVSHFCILYFSSWLL
jgi:sulfur relay (sulfurtransferase) complex TusBCD TusD component (DsrE family)